MRKTIALLAGVLAASLGLAQEPSWPEVVKRKDLWPAQCTLKKSLQFQSGKGVRAGQKVDVLDIQAAQVDLGAAGMSFSVSPEDTDCLAVARAQWSALTPAQRELTYTSILTRKDLWPYKVALTEPIELGRPDGVLQPGTQVVLFDLDKSGKLSLITERTRTGFELEADATDLLAQVRKADFALLDQELEVGLRSIAVPVRDARGNVVAAINVGTHASRFSLAELESRCLPPLRHCAAELARMLLG